MSCVTVKDTTVVTKVTLHGGRVISTPLAGFVADLEEYEESAAALSIISAPISGDLA